MADFGHNTETIAHVLRDCPSVRMIWQSVVLVCLEDILYLVPIDSWLARNLQNLKDDMFRGVREEIMLVFKYEGFGHLVIIFFCKASHNLLILCLVVLLGLK